MTATLVTPIKPALAAVTLPKCSTCLYAQKFGQDGRADCFGHPPSVHMVGASQGPLGPQFHLETFVPRVHKDRPACALYKQKLDFITNGSA